MLSSPYLPVEKCLSVAFVAMLFLVLIIDGSSLALTEKTLILRSSWNGTPVWKHAAVVGAALLFVSPIVWQLLKSQAVSLRDDAIFFGKWVPRDRAENIDLKGYRVNQSVWYLGSRPSITLFISKTNNPIEVTFLVYSAWGAMKHGKLCKLLDQILLENSQSAQQGAAADPFSATPSASLRTVG